MALIPLEDARRLQPSAEDYPDALLEKLIMRAQETIEQITDRKLERQADFAEYLEAANGFLYPRRIPIETVTSITLDGQPVTGYAVEDEEINLQRQDYRTGYRLARHYRRRRYRVTYTGGYVFEGAGANLPVTLSEAAYELVSFFAGWREFVPTMDGNMPGPGLDISRNAARMIKQGIPRIIYDRLKPHFRQKPRVYDGY